MTLLSIYEVTEIKFRATTKELHKNYNGDYDKMVSDMVKQICPIHINFKYEKYEAGGYIKFYVWVRIE